MEKVIRGAVRKYLQMVAVAVGRALFLAMRLKEGRMILIEERDFG